MGNSYQLPVTSYQLPVTSYPEPHASREWVQHLHIQGTGAAVFHQLPIVGCACGARTTIVVEE